MPATLHSCFAAVAFVILAVAPGIWIAFRLKLEEVSFWVKLGLAVVLSPLVVTAQFYLVRWLGMPFGAAAVFLTLLNLPAIWLVWKRRGEIPQCSVLEWLVGASAIVIPLLCVSSLLGNTDARIYSGHSWLHADAIYMFARGYLFPEDPNLAGLRLSYPVWPALVLQGLQSYLANCPPVCNYIWSNLLWLIATYGFAIAVTKEMGGGKLAQVACGVMLLLGTNPVGYLLMKLAPLHTYRQFWGDPRYSPWVVKFLIFSPMAMALAMLMALIYLMLRSARLQNATLWVIFLLLASIGILYPLLLPPACAMVGARVLSSLAERKAWNLAAVRREWLILMASVLLAGLLTYLEVRLITADRQIATREVLLSTIPSAARKLVATVIATALLIVGLLFTIRNCWRARPQATVYLLLGAAASCLLYAAFRIPYYENEYKFVFPIAMCLAVFPALALERVWQQLPRPAAITSVTLTGLFLFGTYGYWTSTSWTSAQFYETYPLKFRPPVETGSFQVSLNQQHPWSGICAATRTMTPPDAVLLVDDGSFYFPGFTERSLYVPPTDENYAGVNHGANGLDGDVRGYGTRILEERRATLAQFFRAEDPVQTDDALQRVLALRRPVAVIAQPTDNGLFAWLKQHPAANQLYAANGYSLWLIEPRPPQGR